MNKANGREEGHEHRASSIRFVLSAFILVAVAALMKTLMDGPESLRMLMQLAVFPLLLLLIGLIKIKSLIVPRGILLAAAAFVACGAIVRYSDVGLEAGAFGVAKLQSDPLENTTRMLRDNVRRSMSDRSSGQIGVINAQITNEQEARQLLDQEGQLGGVIWGSERWLNIAVRTSAPLSLKSLAPDSFARGRLRDLKIDDLKIVAQVPLVGISNGLDVITGEFLAKLIMSVQRMPQALRGESDRLLFESQLNSAALMRARWTSPSHLAVVKWMLGTFDLLMAIEQPYLGWGEQRCAEVAFRSAENITRKSGGGDALRAAIANNQAILRLMRGEFAVHPDKVLSAAVRELQQVYRLKDHAALAALEADVWNAISFNLKALEESGAVSKEEE